MKSLSSLVLALSLVACTGGSPAKNPDDPPPFDDPKTDGPGPTAPASSAKVKEGMEAIQAKDFAKAKEILTAAVAEAPSDPQAAFYLGVALEQGGDLEGARSSYEKALSLDGKLTEAAVNLSAILLDSNQAKAALPVVAAALKNAPAHPMLLMNHALALEATGDAAGALAAYGKAVKAQPDNLELRYAHAELLAGAGKKDEALAELRKVAAGADAKLIAAVANQFGKLGAFADCVSTLDKAISNKAGPDLHTRRGVCRHELKDEAGAKSDFEAALKLEPKFAPAQYYLGRHYKAAGKLKEAKAAFEKAVELSGGKGVGEAAKKELDELAGGKGTPKK
ncbi:MAG: tetratricopeptide repeat protein [Myxococcales bacterium]|nr:tetratricopeptide repeat protein [Myxococcales bacterium]